MAAEEDTAVMEMAVIDGVWICRDAVIAELNGTMEHF